MELAMANGFGGVGFTEMNEKDMMWVDGGIDLGWIGSGIAVAGAGCFAILCAPASVFVGAAYIGTLACSAAVGAGAGLMIGQGLIS